MNKFILIVLTASPLALAGAQDAASTPPASADDSLRQQVRALTESVKALQQQVKDQQTKIDQLNQQNAQGPQTPEPSPVAAAAASPSPSPAAKAPARFATEDTSVVATTTAPAATPTGVNQNGTALPGSFPTTDTSVVTSAPATISSSGVGAS